LTDEKGMEIPMEIILSQFLQQISNGIVMGSVYMLLALGITLIFSIMRVVNFAHGEIYMLGGYFCWEISGLLGNYWVAFLVAVLGTMVLGYLVERLAFRPLYKYGPANIQMFIVALGLVVVFQEGASLRWTAFGKTLTAPYGTVRKIGYIFITDERLIVVGVSIILAVIMAYFIYRTKTGKAMRATAQDRLGSRIVGINSNRISSISFITGSMLAGAAGALLSPVFMLVPNMGAPMIGKLFVIMVLGGLGSVGGAIVGSYILGIAENLFSGYLWSEWTYAVGFVLLISILSFRPRGLFGKE
jgi:branched-chain amino acid transport system permease protein